MAAKARQRIPADWTDRSKNAWIDDIDLWLLLEAKHQLLAGWLRLDHDHRGAVMLNALKQ